MRVARRECRALCVRQDDPLPIPCFLRQATASLRLLGLVCFGLLCLTSAAMAAQAGDRNVLVLYSHEREMAIYAPFDRALRSQMESAATYPLTFYTEYLDLLRFPGDEQQQKLVEYLRVKYSGKPINLIVAVSPLAFNFVSKNGDALFPGTPVVFASVNIRRIENHSLKPNVTGVAVIRDLKNTLDIALRLQPDTTQVIIPVGVSAQEKSWTAELRDSLRPYESHVTITYLSDLPMDGILERLRSLPQHTIVLFTSIFFYDGAGHYFAPEEALNLICQASNAPVYGTDATYLGSGIVGGHLYDVTPVGNEAARMGARILAGESPSMIPVRTLDPNYDMFDARQLNRWRISRARLPAGSVVEFGQPSFWTLYKRYVLACLAVLLLQSLGVVLLVAQARKVKQSESRLRILSQNLINAQEEERKRIARELHDDFSQRLALLGIGLGSLEEPNAQRLVDGNTLSALRSTLDELVKDIHQLSHTLHSSKLRLLGLKAALKELCGQTEKGRSIAVELQADELTQPIPAEIALCFYRVAQEAINNAMKYSGAGRVVVALSTKNAKLTMRITDSGKGFDPSKAREGLGLESMRERMHLINGELLVQSRPGGGTELIARVVLTQSPGSELVAVA
jgi:signal transduction histidine kinase